MKPVWIVDDDRSIRWVFEKALSREGIAYNSFASAREALDALPGGAPQVLISDIRMPGQSGIELLQEVKEKHPAVPVIVMTAYSDLEAAVAAFQGGAFEYLPKPFDVDHAIELVRRGMDETTRQAEAPQRAGMGQEGVGVVPDELVEFAPPDLAAKKDTLIARAEALLADFPKGNVDVYVFGSGGLFRRYQEFTAPSVTVVTGFDPFFGF